MYLISHSWNKEGSQRSTRKQGLQTRRWNWKLQPLRRKIYCVPWLSVFLPFQSVVEQNLPQTRVSFLYFSVQGGSKIDAIVKLSLQTSLFKVPNDQRFRCSTPQHETIRLMVQTKQTCNWHKLEPNGRPKDSLLTVLVMDPHQKTLVTVSTVTRPGVREKLVGNEWSRSRLTTHRGSAPESGTPETEVPPAPRNSSVGWTCSEIHTHPQVALCKRITEIFATKCPDSPQFGYCSWE